MKNVNTIRTQDHDILNGCQMRKEGMKKEKNKNDALCAVIGFGKTKFRPPMIPSDTIFESKVCKSRFCDNILIGNQTKYCSATCGHKERGYAEMQRNLEKRKHNVFKPMPKSFKCKFCQNSKHTVFCSTSHEMMYKDIMQPIDKALGREKQEL